jgi:hypothetical protein
MVQQNRKQKQEITSEEESNNGHHPDNVVDFTAHAISASSEDAPWAGDETVDFRQMIAKSAVGAEVPKQKSDVKKVAARNPHNQEWIRRYECEEAQLPFWVIRDKNDRSVSYILPPEKVDMLAKYAVKAHIELLINQDGELFFCVVPFVDFYGNTYDYWETMQEVLQVATTECVKPLANRNGNRYEIERPPIAIPEPSWPEIDWGVLYGIAFRRRILRDGHPALKKFIGGQ